MAHHRPHVFPLSHPQAATDPVSFDGIDAMDSDVFEASAPSARHKCSRNRRSVVVFAALLGLLGVGVAIILSVAGNSAARSFKTPDVRRCHCCLPRVPVRVFCRVSRACRMPPTLKLCMPRTATTATRHPPVSRHVSRPRPSQSFSASFVARSRINASQYVTGTVHKTLDASGEWVLSGTATVVTLGTQQTKVTIVDGAAYVAATPAPLSSPPPHTRVPPTTRTVAQSGLVQASPNL